MGTAPGALLTAETVVCSGLGQLARRRQGSIDILTVTHMEADITKVLFHGDTGYAISCKVVK